MAAKVVTLPLRRPCSHGCLAIVPYSHVFTTSLGVPIFHLLAAIAYSVAPFLPTFVFAALHTKTPVAETRDLYGDVFANPNSTTLVPCTSTSREPVSNSVSNLLAEIASSLVHPLPTSPDAQLRKSCPMQQARDQPGAFSPEPYSSSFCRTPTGSTMQDLMADIAYSLPLFQLPPAPAHVYITFPDPETWCLYDEVCSRSSPSSTALVPYSSNLSTALPGTAPLYLLAAVALDLAPLLPKSAPASTHLSVPSKEVMDHFGDVSHPALKVPTRLELPQAFTSHTPGLDLLAAVVSDLERPSPLQAMPASIQAPASLSNIDSPSNEAPWVQRQAFEEMCHTIPTELYQVSWSMNL